MANREETNGKPFLAVVMIVIMLIGVILASSAVNVKQMPVDQSLGLKSAEEIQTEQQWGALAPLAKVAKSFGDSLGNLLGQPKEDSVGIEAELGYSDISGQSIVFQSAPAGGVFVGYVGMAGVFVKPHLGKYKQLKLYDESTGQEGEVWVRPIIKVKVYEAVPEEWSFSTKVKVIAGDELLNIKEVSEDGKGNPPGQVKMDKVSVRGRTLHQLLKKAMRKAGEAESLCFYADYQGVVKFPNDEQPVVKKLENIKLGCFDFAVHPTGDFEMKVDKNITVAPLAEVIAGGEGGLGGWEKEITTETVTVTMPYTSYTTILQSKSTVTTIFGTITKTITYTRGETLTLTKYKTHTVTKKITQWKTKTHTVTKTIHEAPVTRTVTKTKTVTITKRFQSYPYSSGIILLTYPYSEFIFLPGG